MVSTAKTFSFRISDSENFSESFSKKGTTIKILIIKKTQYVYPFDCSVFKIKTTLSDFRYKIKKLKSIQLMLSELQASLDSVEATPIIGSATSTGARFAVVSGHSFIILTVSVRDRVQGGFQTFFKVFFF